VINSDDLADALEQGEIFGAGLDVITGEPNIGPDHRLVPHMGSADVDTRKKMAELCKLNLAEPQKQLTSGVRNGINGAKGEALLAEVKP
jgi:glyoxylate/hydroxypyruvate reductase